MSGSAAWHGDLTLRPGLITFTGRIGATELHSHAAVQVYRCRQGQIRVTDDSGATAVGGRVVIPTRARHRVEATAGTVGTTMFLDPSGNGAPEPGLWVRSVAGWVDEERSAFADAVLSGRVGTDAPGNDSLGSRIERSVRDRLPDRVTVADLASELAVSEASLRRAAKEELGLGVQAYTRWVRLILALEEVAAGRSITDAAHAAGFADGSHANRACREMFGLSPSEAVAQVTIAGG